MSSALLSYNEAAALVAARAQEFAGRRPALAHVDLAAASGRVLAEPVIADRDQPPFPRSTRDGYACRAEEAAAHGWLRMAGATRAGAAPSGPVQPGTAWEIMTGAPVPSGADAVVMLENMKTEEGRIRLRSSRSIEAGENIVARGAEALAGTQVLAAGTRLGPAQIALAAAFGYASVPVFARPRVAILTTGDELVPVDATPGPGQIRNSNAPMLAALVAAAGGEPCLLPVAADDPQALDSALGRAARTDLLLITGGVSAGKFDLVEDALARAGAEFHFTGVRIQPGKPVVFGELLRSSGDAGARIQPFFGLPGNPISSAVTCLLFAAPVMAALSGSLELGPRFSLARLAADCKGKPPLTRFVPAFCTFGGAPEQMPEVATVAWQGSGDLAAFARTNCFLCVPDDAERLQAGAIVRILLT
jgi:molybdopterin molybdotransferase